MELKSNRSKNKKVTPIDKLQYFGKLEKTISGGIFFYLNIFGIIFSKSSWREIMTD
jgi:hypothetical protein